MNAATTPPIDTSGDRSERRRAAAIAGHTDDAKTAQLLSQDIDPTVRSIALGALSRMGELSGECVQRAAVDDSPIVRRRVAELAGPSDTNLDLLPLLNDDDDSVVEVAAWAAGERVEVGDETLNRLTELALAHPAPLVREAAVAALGAIGDQRGLPAILQGCSDKPAIRRRAVLALAPFDGDDVDQAIAQAEQDRDWQVRQSALVLTRARDGLS